MKILIHDQAEINIGNIIKDNSIETFVISNNGNIKPCICCFACWIKTPGQCIIKDGYDNMGVILSKCTQVIIISQCYYGCFSPFVKNVLDRSICPYILPYFKTENGVTHHPKRYGNNISYSFYFYGKTTETEKDTALKLCKKIGRKHKAAVNVSFYNSFDEIKEV